MDDLPRYVNCSWCDDSIPAPDSGTICDTCRSDGGMHSYGQRAEAWNRVHELDQAMFNAERKLTNTITANYMMRGVPMKTARDLAVAEVKLRATYR